MANNFNPYGNNFWNGTNCYPTYPINPIPNQTLANPMTNGTNVIVEEHIPKVHGIEGAKAYGLGTNSDKVFLDANDKGVIYIKSTDAGGFATVEAYRLQGPLNLDAKTDNSNYDELFKKLDKRLDNIEKRLNKNVNS